MRTDAPYGPTLDELRLAAVNQMLPRLILHAGAGRLGGLPERINEQILTGDGRHAEICDEQITLRLMAVLAALWERGWQPADLAHVTRRAESRAAGLLASAVTEQARRTGASGRAPSAWVSQLRVLAVEGQELGLMSPAADRGWWAVEVQVRAGVPVVAAWIAVLTLVAQLDRLPALERLVDPPSSWGRGGYRPSAATGDGHDRGKLFGRIRALLAKAEATSYAAEAEAFTAKAQDLMTRHAIDEALLHADDARPVDVVGVRVHLQSPYAGEKVQLLSAVAEANRCRTIFLQNFAMATVVGTPVDVDQVEMLFTSLLIQAVRAMAEAGAVRAGSFDRSASFRRSFLVSYAVRIGERLQEADEQAVRSYGAELVPVLSRQADAVEREFDRLFPHTRQRQASRYSLRGWQAGRAAADQAVFTAGRLGRSAS